MYIPSVKSGAPRRTTKDNNNPIKYFPKLKEQGFWLNEMCNSTGWKKGWDEDVDDSEFGFNDVYTWYTKYL